MINSVRNTVLSVLNKNNYGYISPSDFNQFAKQAQMDLFEDYFYNLNYQIVKENARQSGTGLADISKSYEEVIASFSETAVLAPAVTPAVNTYITPQDYYLLNVVEYTPTGVEVEKVEENKIRNLTASTLMGPTTAFPLYVERGNNIAVYPTTINGATDITAYYIRNPKDPKWTWVQLTSGGPVFDASAADYQDFELPLSDEPDLVMKILEYAGVSIREGDVVKFADSELTQESQSEK
tara:strand:- start:87 stop:800 length:714 start_codon:yes stop_codon:yes gene_type:complete